MNAKNKKKFVELYDTSLDAVFRFCYLRTNNRELAIDMSQQAFLKAWIYVREREEELNLRALVYKIARNMIIDWYRKKKEQSLDLLFEAGFDPPDDFQADQATQSELTLKILDYLSEGDREILILRYINELKPSEIAEVSGENVNVVSVRIHRAKARLKDIIDKKGHELF